MTHRFWDNWLQKCCDLENWIWGPSRSLEMSPFDRSYTDSYWCCIIAMALYLVVWKFLIYSMLKNVMTLKSGSEITQGHWNRQVSIRHLWLTFHGNHGPISTVSEQRFQFKISHFPPPPCFLHPLGIEYRRLGSKTRMMGLWAEKEVCQSLQPSGYNTPMWQTDGWTRCHSKDCASRRRVGTNNGWVLCFQ